MRMVEPKRMSDVAETVADAIADASSLIFIAEGAANIVYKIRDHKQSRYLLRLRKKLPSQPSAVDVYGFYTDHILPLFPPHSVASMRLVKVDPAVLRQLNMELDVLEREGVRDQKRRGTELDTSESYGILVENMTAESIRSDLPLKFSGREEVLGTSGLLSYAVREDRGKKLEVAVLDFKPKWLTQSRDAPQNWRYCRTCALRRYRAKDKPEYGFCPFDLVSGSRQRVEKSVRALLPKQLDITSGMVLTLERVRTIVTEFIMHTDVFRALAQIQRNMDKHGVMDASHSEEPMNFLTAMTVRDCTAFVRIIYSEFDEITAAEVQETNTGDVHGSDGSSTYIEVDGYVFAVSCRLADLDIKDGNGNKHAYWRSIEESLNEGGWYTSADALIVPCR
ncbi:inositol-pentakisphosphate 2-kinase [Lipomyces kononenkoae]|uniref:Inositol-pentakisphosphate 2-kinase n=1 Tax=Lipomyces kononenkoae TaxID=34357 RepID=A0ACC3SWS3_LIPKO